MVTRARLFVIALAVVFGLVSADHVGTVQAEATPVAAAVEAPAHFAPHPDYHRSCGWANCTWYLNKRETRIASYGGAILVGMLCAMLQNTVVSVLCVPLQWAVAKAGDNAIAAGRCVKFTTGRWYPAFWGVGTYKDWRCA